MSSLALGQLASGAGHAESLPNITLELEVRVPMRDGVSLAATLYRPADAGSGHRVPVLIVKTPYGRVEYHEWAKAFVGAGFAVALVDARGRGDSDGTFRAGEDDGRDGHDAIEWLGEQPWCDGKVGTFGGSWDGFWQWSAMKERPAHLYSASPTTSALPGVDFPMLGNVLYPYALRWLVYVSGRSSKLPIFADSTLWSQWFREVWRGRMRLRDLDSRVGQKIETFQRWLEHPTYDAFWQKMTPTDEEYARLDLPILSITGHYDDDQIGALTYYRRHLAHASPAARARHLLVIGPWDHAGTRSPAKDLGGFALGAGSVIDMQALHIAWFDWTLRGGPRPPFLSHPVVAWVTGADEWRGYTSLEEMAPKSQALPLGSDGRADDVAHTGTLGTAPGRSASDRFVVDAADERIADRDPSQGMATPLLDRLDAVPPPGASLVYETAPLDADLDLGAPALTAWLSIDARDADLSARLYEVRPDGRTLFLSMSVMRARHRKRPDREVLVEPGRVLRYDFDAFTVFARRVPKGSRLRLVLGPPLGFSWPNNRGSGKPVVDEVATDGRATTITLHHDARRPSQLRLGLLAPGEKVAPFAPRAEES